MTFLRFLYVMWIVTGLLAAALNVAVFTAAGPGGTVPRSKALLVAAWSTMGALYAAVQL